MTYSKLPGICFCLIIPLQCILAASPAGGGGGIPGIENRERVRDPHPGRCRLVLRDQAASTTTSLPDRPAEETEATVKNRGVSPSQTGKKAPPRDFEPSEKIKADKAVDFPADI